MAQNTRERKPWRLIDGRSINCYFFKLNWNYWYLHLFLSPIIIVLIVVLLVGFFLNWYTASQHALDTVDTLYKGETKLYTIGGIATLLQQGLSITSDGSTVSAYELPTVPALCSTLADNATLTATVVNQVRSHLNTFMMEQSLFTVSFDFITKVDFYVVNGEGNYDLVSKGEVSSVDPADIAFARLATTLVQTEFIEVSKTGEYYFVALANETATVNGNYEIVVKKSVYCTDTATQSVLNSTDINMPVNLYRNTIVVVKNEGFPNNTGTEDVINLVTYSMWYIYTLYDSMIFVSLALFVLIIAFATMLFALKKKIMLYVSRYFYGTGLDQKSPTFAFMGKFLAFDRYHALDTPGQSVRVLEGENEADWEMEETSGRSGAVSMGSSAPEGTYVDMPGLAAADEGTKSTEPKIPSRFTEGDRVRVVTDFLSTAGGELSMREGDSALVVSTADNGWAKLDFNGQTGIFPENLLIKDMEPSVAVGEPEYPPADATAGYMPSMDIYSAAPTNVAEYVEKEL